MDLQSFFGYVFRDFFFLLITHELLEVKNSLIFSELHS